MIKVLVPHDVVIVGENGKKTVLKRTGLARMTCRSVPAGEVDGIPFFRQEYGEVWGLPDPEEGVWLVVSSVIAMRYPERKDLLIVAQPVRDDNGNVIGCRGLTRYEV